MPVALLSLLTDSLYPDPLFAICRRWTVLKSETSSEFLRSLHSSLVIKSPQKTKQKKASHKKNKGKKEIVSKTSQILESKVTAFTYKANL